MQCGCGNTIKNPSYLSNSKYDYMCSDCKGYDSEWELTPPSGEELLKINLDKYNKQELSGGIGYE